MAPASRPAPEPTTPNFNPDYVSWQQPSIRIRRQPSSNAIPRARGRAATTSLAEPPLPGSGAEYLATPQPALVAGHEVGSSSRDPGSYFTSHAPSSSAARSNSGIESNQNRQDANQSVTPDGGRRRSSSDPTRRHWDALQAAHTPGLRGSQSRGHMPALPEVDGSPDASQFLSNSIPPVTSDSNSTRGPGLARRFTNALRPASRTMPVAPVSNARRDTLDSQYDSDMVNVLDTIDPEISTLNTLTNVQNSLFVPSLGKYLNRTPTYTLTRRASQGTFAGTIPEKKEAEEAAEEIPEDVQKLTRQQTAASLTSKLDDDHFAVLPHGERLEGWSAEDRAELNDHVRHLLHSRREGIKRGFKGFGQYVRKPLGFFVTVYATLITVFGTAWVLFLIGWINVGGRKDYLVNIIDNILVALFAIMGDGLAPFRAVDTYHMCFIAHYHHLTWRLRKEQALPKLQNHNDLPGLDEKCGIDAEGQDNKPAEYSVLNPKQQARLEHHQKKFARSHTFYKPHETNTHFAFPLRILVAVVVLLDCHSLLQISLGACTWGIDYRVRPFALTTVILCCSITCNITAGVLISIGDRRTRKKDVLERMFRQELTAQAIEKFEKRHQKENERNEVLEIPGADTSTPEPGLHRLVSGKSGKSGKSGSAKSGSGKSGTRVQQSTLEQDD